ncbi:hypothetical protein Fmac_015012 [Flemingia macrophylla]|uniref:J domain-containing protein n=1 Tax=Flemingia macrophylla TaxID=520843 RepID=A0ABD1MDF9_9FABA
MTFPTLASATTFFFPPHHVFTTKAWMEQRQRLNSSYSRPHSVVLSTTHYGILRIDISASGDEIKAVYRRLARTYYLDVVPVDPKKISSSEFLKINVAYCTLSNPKKRARYDKTLTTSHNDNVIAIFWL